MAAQPICPVCQHQHAPGPCPSPDVSARPSGVPPVTRNYVEGECIHTGEWHRDVGAELAGRAVVVVTVTREALTEYRGGLMYRQVRVMPLAASAAPSVPQPCPECVRLREAIADAVKALDWPEEALDYRQTAVDYARRKGRRILRRALEVRP